MVFQWALINVEEKYKAYYKWTPAEWAYGDQMSDKKMISKASGILSKKAEDKGVKTNFSAFEIALYENMTKTLKELIEKNKYFAGMTVFISISDDNRARGVENYSAQLLNTEDIYNAFIKRFEK